MARDNLDFDRNFTRYCIATIKRNTCNSPEGKTRPEPNRSLRKQGLRHNSQHETYGLALVNNEKYNAGAENHQHSSQINH